MPVFFVKPTALRSDCRLVVTFLWGDCHDCNTDGNSHNPASRVWTELYCCNRANPAEVFDVWPRSQEPLLLQVESPHEWLAARVAYFLAVESDGVIGEQPDGPYIAPRAVASRMGEFDLEEAQERVRRSPFQRATLVDPYPNLRQCR